MAIDENRHHKWNRREQGAVEDNMNFMHQEMFTWGPCRATYYACPKLSSVTVNIKQGKDKHGNHRNYPGY